MKQSNFLTTHFLFFFNDTATTEIYTLSLHDALPISCANVVVHAYPDGEEGPMEVLARDRKSTRLNSSHSQISYAVFCLKKQQQKRRRQIRARRLHKPPHKRK